VHPWKANADGKQGSNRGNVTLIRASGDDTDITQQELAIRLGFTHRQVVNMDHRHRAIHASNIIMIARALERTRSR
jgi:hypothetical protein